LQEAEAQRELALVLRAMGRNREALAALNRAHNLFSMLQATQDQSDTNERLAHLENDFLSLVGYWGESIDEIDRYTRGHCQRVAAYACLMAEQIGVPQHEIVWFRMGALLHDVGKTALPEEILNKPGRLLPEERIIMERHTLLGEELLSQIEFPWDIRPMVRSHHERWDGDGYPDGLAGLDIPVSARILHIADVFDALTTNRSYRARMTADEARDLMRRDSTSFDPDHFALFEALFPTFRRIWAAGLDGNESVVDTSRNPLGQLVSS
jgi:putative nucleotidyltransferase with HDIG domain